MSTEITLDPMLAAAIAGIIIPMVTGVITKLDSSSHVKALTALVLSVLTAVLTCASKGMFTPDMLAKTAMAAFGANVTTYIGAWKPMGKTDLLPLQGKTKNFGIGKPAVAVGNGGDL